MSIDFKRFNKGIVLRPIEESVGIPCSNPVDNIEGSVWVYQNKLRSYLNGIIEEVLTINSSGQLTVATFSLTDDQLIIEDGCTSTKKFKFQASGITGGQTREITVPDKNISLAGTICEIFTGTTTTIGTCSCATNLVVWGNLTVHGDSITANTATLDVEDVNITVNNGGNQTTADMVAGLTVEMSDATDVNILYCMSLPSRFKVGDINSEQEIITTGHTQTITGNKTLNNPCVKLINGTLCSNIIEGGTVACGSIGRLRPPKASICTLQNYITTCCEGGGIFYSTDENKLLYHNGTELKTLGGEGISIQIDQPCHGFSVRTPIYHNGTSWIKAQANSAETLPLYIVTKIDGGCPSSRFTANKFGRIFEACHGLIPGQYYFTSACIAGDISSQEPLVGYSSPVLYVENTSYWHALVHRPNFIGDGSCDSDIGSIVAFALPICNPPSGYLAATGGFVSRTTYGDLFNKIGTTFGFSNATNFGLPDVRGRFLRGQSNGCIIDPDRGSRTALYPCGATGDNVGSYQSYATKCHSHNDTFTIATSGAHIHSFPAYPGCCGGCGVKKGSGGSLINISTYPCNGAHTHCLNGAVTTASGSNISTETRPINIYVNYFIRYAPKSGTFSDTTNETIVVTTETSLDSALYNARNGIKRDILIGGSFNITSQKRITSNITIRQNTNAYKLTVIGGCCGLTEGIPQVSKIKFTAASIPTGYNCQQIYIQAPRLGLDQQYYIWFDDSTCCTDPDPCLCGISVRVNTNGDTTNANIASGTVTAINCHACAGCDFIASICCGCSATVVITNKIAKNVSNIQSAVMWYDNNRFTGSCTTTQDQFGYSSTIYNNISAFGAPHPISGCCPEAGKVYIFEQDTCGPCNWGQEKIILSSDPNNCDWFGAAVKLNNNCIVIGAPKNDVCTTCTGSIYIHSRNNCGSKNWGLVAQKEASDLAAGDFFGWSVDICGCYVVSGAPYANVGLADSGAAYIFERNTCGSCSWGQVKKIVPISKQANSRFGYSVAISQLTIVVSAPFYDSGSPCGCCVGAIYIFDRICCCACMWSQTKQITGSVIVGKLGTSVAICGCYIAASAPYLSEGACGQIGRVYIYKRNYCATCNNCCNPCNWGLLKSMTSSCLEVSQSFGYSLSINGCFLAVGAPGNNVTNTDSGAVYFFQKDKGGLCNWGESSFRKPIVTESNAGFGYSLGIHNGIAAVGANADNEPCTNTGKGYILGPGGCFCLSTTTNGVTSEAPFKIDINQNGVILDGLNIETCSNGLSIVEIHSNSQKNRLECLNIKTGSTPTTPLIKINGSKNIIINNYIDTCSACTVFNKIDICMGITGNIVSNNILD